MEKKTCSIDGCEKPVKRQGLCYGHYMKNWRYGTPTPEHPKRWVDIRGEVFGTLTVAEREGTAWRCICSCGNERLASAGELNRAGDASTCGVRRNHLAEEPSYTAAHGRVRDRYGSASLHPCVDCGSQARHWSYDHSDKRELLAYGVSANAIAYSANPEHYVARCVSCHKRFDLNILAGREA